MGQDKRLTLAELPLSNEESVWFTRIMDARFPGWELDDSETKWISLEDLCELNIDVSRTLADNDELTDLIEYYHNIDPKINIKSASAAFADLSVSLAMIIKVCVHEKLEGIDCH